MKEDMDKAFQWLGVERGAVEEAMGNWDNPQLYAISSTQKENISDYELRVRK